MQKPFVTLCFALVGILASMAPRPAAADLITSASLIPTPSKTVDFSQFAGSLAFINAPIEVGGLVGESITLTSTNANAAVGDGLYGFGSNGNWNTALQGFSGLNGEEGAMTYTFNAGPVSAVGGFLNYVPSLGNAVIQALAVDGVTILESYNLSDFAPISTPNGVNEGAFRGIVRTTADIGAFRILNDYIALDDLQFSRATAIPEPTAAILLGTGLLGLLVGHRRMSRDKR